MYTLLSTVHYFQLLVVLTHYTIYKVTDNVSGNSTLWAIVVTLILLIVISVLILFIYK